MGQREVDGDRRDRQKTGIDSYSTIKQPVDDSIQIKTVNGYKTFLKSFGDWSQVVSKSGKVYFYNKKTLVNQWKKPIEWLTSEDKINQSTPVDPGRGKVTPIQQKG